MRAGVRTWPEIVATNSAATSGNPLHDRDAAIALGHKDALISGADAITYLTYPAVAAWGCQWFERGSLDGRLLKPIYDGDICEIVSDQDGLVELRVAGELRASGRVALTTEAIAIEDIPRRAAFDRHGPLGVDEVPIGTILPTIAAQWSESDQVRLLAAIGDSSPIYRRPGLLHPHRLIELAIRTLADNFEPEVLVHLGSHLVNYRPIACTAVLEARGLILAAYETRGHQAVLLDVQIHADGACAASVRHRMIYRLRPKPQTSPNP